MTIGRQILYFLAAVAVCGVGFLILDLTLMNMQGLDLIFRN